MAKNIDEIEIRAREKELRERFASRLEEIRQRRGLTIQFVADSAQLAQGHITQLLQGKKNVTVRTLVKLAYALDVDVTDLLKSGAVIKPKPKRGRPRTRRTPK